MFLKLGIRGFISLSFTDFYFFNPLCCQISKLINHEMYRLASGFIIYMFPFFFTTAGIGEGKFTINDNGLVDSLPYSRFHKSSVTKWYLMPSLNFFSQQSFRFSLATKFSFIHYGKIQTSYTDDELSYFGLDKITNTTLYFFEPAFIFQFGSVHVPWLGISIISSFASAYHAHDDSDNSRLNVRGFNFSIGLSLDLSKIKKKK